jgi:hypothetical protein
MSLRWRCAPACGSKVFLFFYHHHPALASLRAGLFSVAPSALRRKQNQERGNDYSTGRLTRNEN